MKTPAKKTTVARRKPPKANGVKYPDILADLEGQRAAILG
jgi:DnaK suppressor protein